MEAVSGPSSGHGIIWLLLFKGEIDVVVLALASDAQPSCLDTREDNSDELAKGSRVEWHNSFGATSASVLGIHSIAWDRSFGWFAYCAEPVSC